MKTTMIHSSWKRATVSAAAVAIACLAGVASAVPADAQGEPSAEQPAPAAVLDDAEALAADAKLYAVEFEVPFDEALQRLTTMVYGTGAVSQAAADEGADLAGRYFDNRAAEFGLVVATRKGQASPKTLSFQPRTKVNYGRLNAEGKKARNQQRQDLRRLARLSDAEVAKAEDILAKPVNVRVKYKVGSAHNLLELTQAVGLLSGQAATIPGFQVAFVDETTSTVRILTKVQMTDSQARAVRALVKVPVEFEYTPTGMVPVANMRGGSKLYSDATATSATPRSCMTSFGARHTSIKTSAGAAMDGMVTAAHCIGTNNVIADDGRNYTLTTGSVSDSRGGYNEADLKFVHGTNGNPLGLGTFYYDHTSNLRSVAGTQSRGGTAVGSGTWDQVTGTATGSYICHLGQASYGSTSNVQSCGEVISVNAAQNSSGTSVTQTGGSFVMVRNTQSGKGTVRSTGTGTLRCYQGDSGGPWFAGTIAYGVMSACAWSDYVNSNQAAYSIYTSTDFFNRIGVNIIVP